MNPSNCECECDKSYDVGEYLDYENCKCRNNLVDKLVEECTGNVEEVKLARITLDEDENKHECSSCTLKLFSIIFTVSVGIGTYFFYYKWIKKLGLKKFLIIEQQSTKLINGRSQRNNH